jgi:hypothetical protein
MTLLLRETVVRFVCFLIALIAVSAEGAAAKIAEPVQVMVLGTWHFANPGLDVVNIEAEDVRTPRRQRELDAITVELARFRPTKIMIEQIASTPDLIDRDYSTFNFAMLRERKDERVQIGYRLAHTLGHRRVYAIDEQPSAGEPDYFPFEKVVEYAKSNGQMTKLQEAITQVEADKKAFQEKQARTHLATLLAEENEPTDWKAGISGYYEVLSIGDTDTQPGAELNAYWYMRNAKIFGKLMQVVEPGDRVLVIFGTSHAYWLRHFAAEVNGFEKVDPRPYLRRAATASPQVR